MMEIAAYNNKKVNLQRQMLAEKYKVVPQKPQIILEVMKKLRLRARGSANPQEKKMVEMALLELNRILYESYAYWRD